MNSRTVERVQSWPTVSVRDGYRGLHVLADDDFSGAAVADDTWLFMLNGRVVGVHEGRIEDFEDASFTAYDAPHLSLPLLFSMQEQDGETQATYYTNDTPLSTTDSTLSDANFTGYVELSENVLSGDYYTVYYGGRSMSAAFVGASEELVKGEEAFERADDEVGLYEVVNVDVEVTDVPEPEDAGSSDADSTGAAAAGAAAASAEGTDEEPDTGTEPGQDGEDAAPTADEDSPSETTADAGATQTSDAPGTEDASDAGGASDAADASAVDASADRAGDSLVDEAESGPATESHSGAGSERGGADERTGGASRTDRPDSRGETGSGSGSVEERSEKVDERPEQERVAGANPADSGGAETPGGEDRAVFSEEAEWRETTTVPSLDPEKSTAPGEGAAGSAAAQADQQTAETSRSAGGQSSPSQSSEPSSGSNERAAALRKELAAREERIEELRARAESAESEAEDLRAELEEVRAERDSLREEVDSLQAELESGGGAGSGSAADAGASDLDPSEALAGTNLFVRYASKADPTLEAVRSPEVDRDAVNANLRLEHHTQFDAGDATVDGEPFERFLEGTAAYRFVSWLVRDLPFELADTGHERDLSDVFEAIPEVDRAELDGSVSVRDEDGEEVRSTFDVVLRDRMGNPLLVAELNPERDPVTGDQMESLVRDADGIAADQDSLAGAFYVTASFFEPGALETAEDATGGGGLLSRSEKASYVKTGRKTGFHLCLVEDRNETFHVTVPEL